MRQPGSQGQPKPKPKARAALRTGDAGSGDEEETDDEGVQRGAGPSRVIGPEDMGQRRSKRIAERATREAGAGVLAQSQQRGSKRQFKAGAGAASAEEVRIVDVAVGLPERDVSAVDLPRKRARRG